MKNVLFILTIATGCFTVNSSDVLSSIPKSLHENVLYYLSFDDVNPRVDAGEMSIKSSGEMESTQGRYGRALVFGKNKPLVLELKQHLWFKPGAMTCWVCPQEWVSTEKASQRGLVVFLRFEFTGGGKFILERQGFDLKTKRQDQLIAVLTELSNFDGVNIVPTSTLNWNEKKWHLIAMNWDHRFLEVSVDGKSFSRAQFPRSLSASECPTDTPAQIQLAYNHDTVDEKTLMDEWIVYKRPLTIGEVREIFNVGSSID